MEYAIYIFTAVLLFAVICLMVICINILSENKALKTHVNVLNKDHNSISKKNIELKELLETQDKIIAEAMANSIDRLN